MTTRKHKGTCAWCFGGFVVEGEHPVRHGWREVGNRRPGHYGLVWHAGNCPGMDHPAYEVSPKGTLARLKATKGALADCEKELARLAERPPLYAEGDFDHGYDRTAREYLRAKFGLRIHDGEKLTIEATPEQPHLKQRFDYERILAASIRTTETDKHHLEQDIEFCQKAIDEWTVKPLAEHKPPAHTMHFAPTERQKKYRRQSYCGQKRFVATTENEAEVTCTKCRKALAAAKEVE